MVVAMAGFGVDEAALLAAAESIRTADRRGVDRPAPSVEHGDRPRRRAGRDRRARTTRAPRTRSTSADGYLCVAYDESDGVQSEACGGAARSSSLLVSAQRLGSGEIVLYGYTTLGTDGELRSRHEDGSPAGPSRPTTTRARSSGELFSDDSLPAEILVRGADGTELARAVVGAPDEGSGSSSPSAARAPRSRPGRRRLRTSCRRGRRGLGPARSRPCGAGRAGRSSTRWRRAW